MTSEGANTFDDDEPDVPIVKSPNEHANLASQSARGLFYLFAGEGITKVIGYVTQIALLYLVSPDDVGAVTIAGTITSFILLIGQAGVIDVLIHRRAFKQWAIPGFWLSPSLGLLSSLLIGISAPIASWMFTRGETFQHQLFWLLILSIPTPLPYALAAVPRAQLSRELRFRALSVVNVTELLLINLFTLFFAWLGFGPYSFVLPITCAGIIVTSTLWFWVRPPWAPRLGLKRWRYLIGDSNRLFASEFGRMLQDQSDYMSLGLFRVDLGLVGIYANGFKFSLQSIRLFMVNMATILFPAFTKLNDQPQRQYEGFFKAQRIIAMVGVSGCLLQAAVAESLVHFLFPPNWYPSVTVMQILSVGMATRMIGGGSFALLKSQGRFATIRNNFWTCAMLQVAGLFTVLSLGGGIVAVSVVVAIVSAFAGPFTFYVAIRPYGGGLREVVDVLWRPIVCGVISVGTAWLVAESIGSADQSRLQYFWQFVVICAVWLPLNALLARLLMRPVWDDLWQRLERLLPQSALAWMKS